MRLVDALSVVGKQVENISELLFMGFWGRGAEDNADIGIYKFVLSAGCFEGALCMLDTLS